MEESQGRFWPKSVHLMDQVRAVHRFHHNDFLKEVMPSVYRHCLSRAKPAY